LGHLPLHGRFPDLESWIRISAPIATVMAIAAPYQAVMENDLRFKALARIEILSSLAALALTIAWIFFGSALAALVGGMMLRAALRTTLLFVAGVPQIAPEFRFSAANLNLVGRFGVFRTTDLALGFFVRRLDRILIAYFFGQEALGIYAFAWSIAVEPTERLIPTFTQVLFPGFSKIKTDLGRIARIYCKGLKVISAINLPIVVIVAVCAPAAVPMLFGQHWTSAGPLIEILSVVAAMRVVMAPSGVLLMSQGRPEITLYWNIGIAVIGTAAMVIIAAIGDVMGVAVAFAGLYVVLFVVHPRLLLRPVLPDIPIGQLMGAIAAPIGLACAAGLSAVVAGRVEPWGGVPELTIQCLMASLVYMSGFFLADRVFVREAYALLRPGRSPR
jgi:O-antigen/teichoic acid export membrane protein